MNGVIFDCDGVVVDSETLSCEASRMTMMKYGASLTMEQMRRFIGKSNRQMIDEVSVDYRVVFPPDIADEMVRVYSGLAAQLQPMPGIGEALKRLRQMGIPTAIGSSGEPERILFSLGQVGLVGCFDALCSATEVEHGKPAPDLFLLAARRLNIPPAQCAVVEDSPYGIRGAKSGGMYAIGYTSTHTSDELRRAGADAVIDHFDKLLDTLEAWPLWQPAS